MSLTAFCFPGRGREECVGQGLCLGQEEGLGRGREECETMEYRATEESHGRDGHGLFCDVEGNGPYLKVLGEKKENVCAGRLSSKQQIRRRDGEK